jgi:hypothetical protein
MRARVGTSWVGAWCWLLGSCLAVDAGLHVLYPADGASVHLPAPRHQLRVEAEARAGVAGATLVCVVLDGGWACEQLTGASGGGGGGGAGQQESAHVRTLTLRWPWPLAAGAHLLHVEALDGARRPTAMQKLRIARLGFGTAQPKLVP